MHGIPILIKDNIDTADKMHTTAGSWALYDAADAKAGRSYRGAASKAGAVIFGKTNLSEWANFRSTGTRDRQTSGWSGRGGQTNMPYFLDQNPSGSSSGSGVAVSANLSRSRSAARRMARSSRRRLRTALSASSLLSVLFRERHHTDLAFAGHCRSDGPQCH